MSTVDQNIDTLIYETARSHFIQHKVEISDAINTAFPFLEILRDHGFITNEMYKDYQKSLTHLSPLQKVVYEILSKLEKKFDLSLLATLFSKVITKKYPDLNDIQQSFRDVLEKVFYQASGEEDKAKKHKSQLSLKGGTGAKLYPGLTWLYPDPPNCNAPPENDLFNFLCEAEDINAKERAAICDTNTILESQQTNEQCAQESKSAEIISEDPKEPSAGHETPKASTSALKRTPGTLDLGNNSALGGATRKRRFRRHEEESVDFSSEILPVTCGEMKGMLHKNKWEQGTTVKCIRSEDGTWYTLREFEIAGGYKKSSKWKQNIRCGGRTLKLLMEEGKISTPPRTYGKQKMLEKPVCEICQYGEKLFCCDTCSRCFHENCHIPPVETEKFMNFRPLSPSRDISSSHVQPPLTVPTCALTGREQGQKYKVQQHDPKSCLKTPSTERIPWSCTFCRIKEFSASQWCLRESEVLARQMGLEEQLKCEFLLLNIYCHSENNISEKIPPKNYRMETSQCMKDAMMVNEIKKKLSNRDYLKVEGFVQDVRSIFQNHRASDRCKNFCLMGISLELKFEQNFKEVFAVQEIKQEHTDS